MSRGTASEPALNTDFAVCGSWLADSGTGVGGLPRSPVSRSSIAVGRVLGLRTRLGGVVGSGGATAGACSVTLVTLAE